MEMAMRVCSMMQGGSSISAGLQHAATGPPALLLHCDVRAITAEGGDFVVIVFVVSGGGGGSW